MRSDKRRAVRRPVQYSAWIARKGEPLEGCVLSDISEKGARLDVENPASIPDEFMLFLSSRGTPRRKCSVAWRTETQIGVKFDEPLPPKMKRNPTLEAMIASRQASLQPAADADAKAEAEASSDAKAETDKTENESA
jgi:hypothetical protein